MIIKRTHGLLSHRSIVIAAVVGLSALLGIGSSFAITSFSLSEKNSNQTINVKMGSPVSLSLHSMYWILTSVKVGASLEQKGAPIQKPTMSGPNTPAGCGVPGTGCGVQTWKFSAIKVGVTHLIATRSSCGEALRCTTTDGTFKVTVKVFK